MRPTRFSLALPAILLALSISASIAGCYFTRSPSRPISALYFRRSTAAPDRCLVVMVPGFLDGPDDFRVNELPNEVARSGSECDSVAIDLHYRHYDGIGVADVVYEDILTPALSRGYQEIWLVGTSMGGLGALLTAERHPELISGIILLSPYVGDESVVREITAAGSAEEWRPPEGIDRQPWTQANYTVHLWSWLRGYARDPDQMPPLYIGWAEGEPLGAGDQLLAEMQPEGHVVVTPGSHGWATWRPMFRRLLDAARPGR